MSRIHLHARPPRVGISIMFMAATGVPAYRLAVESPQTDEPSRASRCVVHRAEA
jgi:hypothetical protein